MNCIGKQIELQKSILSKVTQDPQIILHVPSSEASNSKSPDFSTQPRVSAETRRVVIKHIQGGKWVKKIETSDLMKEMNGIKLLLLGAKVEDKCRRKDIQENSLGIIFFTSYQTKQKNLNTIKPTMLFIGMVCVNLGMIIGCFPPLEGCKKSFSWRDIKVSSSSGFQVPVSETYHVFKMELISRLWS